MAMDRERWHADVRRWWREHALDLAAVGARLGVQGSYWLLVSSAFVPLLAQVPPGQLEATLAGIIGGVGANLLSNVLQGARDDALQRLEEAAADEEQRAFIDAVVDEARALDAAAAELGEQWEAFALTVLGEVERLGGVPRTPQIIRRIGEVGPGVNVAQGDILSAESGGMVVKAGQVTVNLFASDPAQGLRAAGALLGQPESRIEGLPARDSVAVVAGSDSVTVPRDAYEAAPPAAGRREWLERQTLRQVFQRWERHFIPLAGVETAVRVDVAIARYVGDGPQQRRVLDTIPDIRQAFERHERFVLLGDPGGGKTTLLERMALEAFQEAVRDAQARIPFFVSLGDHKEGSPGEFLARQWVDQGYPRGLGAPLEEVVAQGKLLLLADGLNELPRERLADQMDAWGKWEADVNRFPPGNRAVFTCRTLDYENPLPLPQVEVLDLAPERVREYLELHLTGDELKDIWRVLEDDDRACRQGGRADRSLLTFVGNPFVLHAAVEVYRATVELTRNRGRLLHAFAMTLLEREACRILDLRVPNDASRALAGRYLQPLTALAYAMQARSEGTRFKRSDALAVLPADPEPTQVLDHALGANVLHMDERSADAVAWFSHQLLQEGLAAHELLRRFKDGEDLSGLWQAVRLATEMPEPRERGEWEPLPPPPPTGWEETTIAAAGLAGPDLAPLLDKVRITYPVLAARCIDEAGIAPDGVLDQADIALDVALDQTRRNIRSQLLADLRSPQVHLRARIEAGLRLGRIGDPRFERVVGATGVPYIRPALCHVPAGRYLVGNPDDPADRRHDPAAFPDEQHGAEVPLAAFWIGKYPVTNAEFRCFVEAGGYQPGEWWDDLGRRWLGGEDVGGVDAWLAQQRVWKTWPDDWRQPLVGDFRDEELNMVDRVRAMSEEELVAAVQHELSQQRRDQPLFWGDPAYAAWVGDNQPVIGVSWFEASAYCRWLSAHWRADGFQGRESLPANCTVRLPSEAEWEAAARGPGGRRYPWDDEFDPWRANTIEKPARVLRVSPVGAYPDGEAECEALDMSGNVWEWTRSLWGEDWREPAFRYPYEPADGREDLDAPAEVLRVVRGGAFDGDQRFVRCAFRLGNLPYVRVRYNGLRGVLSPFTSGL